MTKEELVKAVKEHAVENYENGWDVVVETYTDEEIEKEIGRARTVKGAIRKMAEMVGIWNEKKEEIESTRW